MNASFYRIAYAFEFLLALLTTFTVWSEVGGQGALDLMHWGWKLGLSFLLAGSFVAYTASLVSASSSFWTVKTWRWLLAMVLTLLVMGVVTYFYARQEDMGETDEAGTVSFLLLPDSTLASSANIP